MNYDKLKQILITILENDFPSIEYSFDYKGGVSTLKEESLLLKKNTSDRVSLAIPLHKFTDLSEGEIKKFIDHALAQDLPIDFIKEFDNKEGLVLDKFRLYACYHEHVDLDLIPHIKFHDIVIYMRYCVKEDSNYVQSTAVTYDFMKHFNITWDQLISRAYANTFASDWFFQDFADIFGSMCGRGSLYVLNYEDCFSNGGILFMYPPALEKIYKKIGPYYVIPSSIDELLIAPAHQIDNPSGLHEVLLDMNKNNVSKDLWLSNHLFYFNGESLIVAE